MASDTSQQAPIETYEELAFDAGERAGVAFGLVLPIAMILMSWFDGIAPWWIAVIAILTFVAYNAFRASRFASVACQTRSKWMRRKAIAFMAALIIFDSVRRSFA